MTRATPIVRPLSTDDFTDLVALCARRPFPESVFFTPEERRSNLLKALDERFSSFWSVPGASCLVVAQEGRITGYALSLANQIEGITGELQTELLDFYCPTPFEFEPLLAEVVAGARENHDSYLVCQVFSGQKREALWLSKAGFGVEQNRNFREIHPTSLAPEHPDYRLRRAQQREMMYVIRMAMKYSPLYTPAGRNVDPQEVSRRFLSVYSQMDVRDKKKVPLVLAERATDLPVGYIILQPKQIAGTKRRLTLYTYDVL